MNLSDDDLKRIYRSYVGKRTDPERGSCPSAGELSEFFEPRLRVRAKMKIVDHISGCSACAEEFEFLRNLQQGHDQIIQSAAETWESDSPPQRTSSVSRRAGSFWRYCSVAAGTLMVIASLFIIMRNGSTPEETRAAPSSINLLQPSQTIPGSIPLTFRWKEFSGADRYVLELFDEALLRIWKSPETNLPHVELPLDIGKKLPTGKSYFWMITAYRSKERLAESELTRFILIVNSP